MTGYYTIMDAEGPVTLCELCALMATNEAFLSLGVTPAQTMAEAAVVESSLLALAGLAGDETFSYSSQGTCSNSRCVTNKEETA